MEQELLILGLLKQGPKHPYQIKRLLKDVIFTYTSLENISIYYPLRQMEEKKWVIKKEVRFKRRPQRYVYYITEEGKQQFKRLLDKNFLTIKRPFFNIDLSLYFLPFIEIDVARRRLRARISLLKKIKADLQKMRASLDMKKSSHLAFILEHNIELVGAEIKFLDRLRHTHLISS